MHNAYSPSSEKFSYHYGTQEPPQSTQPAHNSASPQDCRPDSVYTPSKAAEEENAAVNGCITGGMQGEDGCSIAGGPGGYSGRIVAIGEVDFSGSHGVGEMRETGGAAVQQKAQQTVGKPGRQHLTNAVKLKLIRLCVKSKASF
ncbi:hypothetical protein RUND412_008935, partial [Rhizina undulata]